MIRAAICAAAILGVAACDNPPPHTDADVIVVGGGIAGIAAALDAADAGASVVVIEWSSVPGGHAVEAGGFALVDTPLQQRKGYADSPDLAYREIMAWGEDADREWVRQFVDRAGPDVHDWLTGLGVEFNILLATPESSVPRFHFAGGKAVHAVVPMLRAALNRENIRWALNSRVNRIEPNDGGSWQVEFRNVRDGMSQVLVTDAVVVATGGYEGSLERVRRHWRGDAAEPERILNGAGHFARGDGLTLGESLGAGLSRVDEQVIFVNGLPNPRNPQRGLAVDNPAALRVDMNGRRFVAADATSKAVEQAVLQLEPQTYWMLFDSRGLRQLRIRGAEWLNRTTIADEILNNPEVAVQAGSLAELADRTRLPLASLSNAARRQNPDAQLSVPPFYALQLWPMSRKSLGGLAIDIDTRVLDRTGTPLPGIFAAGEATGVGGVNGRYGGSGTFLAPSVLTGRMAGANAAAYSAQAATPPTGFATATAAQAATRPPPADAAALALVVDRGRDGYWHFEQAHRVILERGYTCERCHGETWPVGPAVTKAQRLERLDTCTDCH